MGIFKFENNRLTLDKAEILLTEEFAIVWKKDTTKDKTRAHNVFKFCYLMEDWASQYKDMPEGDLCFESVLVRVLLKEY